MQTRFFIFLFLGLFSLAANAERNNSFGIGALGLADATLNAYYQHQLNFDGALVFQFSNLDKATLSMGLSGSSLSMGYKFYSQNYGRGNYLLAGGGLFHADEASERDPKVLPILVMGREWRRGNMIIGVETGLGTMGGTSLMGINFAYELP